MDAAEQVAVESVTTDTPQDTPIGSLTPVEIAQKYLDNQTQALAEAQEREQPEAAQDQEDDPQQAEGGAEESVEVDPDAKFVEVDGQKYSINELKAQRMMQADYSRKTAELARQREQVPLEIQKQVQQHAKQYADNLGVIQRAVTEIYSKELAHVDWNRLAEDNPAEFVRLSARANQVNTVMAAAKEEMDRVQKEQQQRSYLERQAVVKNSLEMLPKVIPGWDEKVYQDTMQQGVKLYGLDPQDVAQVTDWQLLHVLHDAVKYRQLQNNKPLIEKKVSHVPRMVKPGAAQPPRQAADEIAKLKARAKGTGSKADAVALVARLMKG